MTTFAIDAKLAQFRLVAEKYWFNGNYWDEFNTRVVYHPIENESTANGLWSFEKFMDKRVSLTKLVPFTKMKSWLILFNFLIVMRKKCIGY